MAAAFFKNAALALDDKEAHELAVAASNVARHYDVQVAQKTLDWINLASVAGMVYGSRLMILRMQNQKAEEAATPDAAQMHAAAGAPFRPFTVQPGI